MLQYSCFNLWVHGSASTVRGSHDATLQQATLFHVLGKKVGLHVYTVRPGETILALYIDL